MLESRPVVGFGRSVPLRLITAVKLVLLIRRLRLSRLNLKIEIPAPASPLGFAGAKRAHRHPQRPALPAPAADRLVNHRAAPPEPGLQASLNKLRRHPLR